MPNFAEFCTFAGLIWSHFVLLPSGIINSVDLAVTGDNLPERVGQVTCFSADDGPQLSRLASVLLLVAR